MIAPAVKLSVRGVAKRFGGALALSDVSLDVHAGEVHAICGENGAGKSTLMKILCGAITDYEGEILLDGETVRFYGPREAESRGVSIVYQELNLVPHLSAAANIFLGRERTFGGVWLRDAQMEREAAEYFHRLEASIAPRIRVDDLRIGDRQLVEIAKALSLDADVLILDEPTSALAEAETARLFRVIGDLRGRGVAILYISHKMDEVFRLADRITVLRDGKRVDTVQRSQTTPNEIIRRMVGREWSPGEMKRGGQVGKTLLRAEGLRLPHRRRAGAWQLDGVDFQLHQGEVLGVAGLLGAGRTELLECLFGASPTAPSGRLFVDESPVCIRRPSEAVRLGLAMVTEDRKALGLFSNLSVAENITISRLDHLQRLGLILQQRERKAVRESIERLAIKAPGAGAPVRRLSGGNQQKCILARWLLTTPRALLLDEPTRGIDVGAKQEIYKLLRALAADGMGILMTSSELPELIAVCDRIFVLCAGRKTAEFDAAQATEEELAAAMMGFNYADPA